MTDVPSIPRPETPQRRRSWPWALALVALSVALLVPSLRSETFLAAPGSALRIPLVSWWRNVPTIFSGDFLIFTEGQYRPLSYALLAVARGFVRADDVVFWHLWLAAFHALNALLVFAIARRFARSPAVAFLAGAVFAAHPLAALFANDINRFPWVLGGTFFLGATLAYLRFARSRRPGAYAACLALFAAGILTSKAVFALPAFLLLYELLYERPRLRVALARIAPFAACALTLAPLWVVLRPHPLYFDYPDFPPGSGWFSLYTFVGSMGLFLRGVVAGVGFEPPPGELVDRVMSLTDSAVLLWSVAILAALVLAVHELLRRRWLGVGILLAVAGVVPFASVAFHRTGDFLSWNSVYLVTAGFALVAGALLEDLLALRRRWQRACAGIAAALLVVYFGALQARDNSMLATPVTWWERVLEVNPRSEAASLELGRACLAERDRPGAMRRLFSPQVDALAKSSLIAAEAYCLDNVPLAAGIHLHNTLRSYTPDLLTRNRISHARATMAWEVGALDYAEAALGPVRMTNPYDTQALKLLARIFQRKGFLRAARMHLDVARRIDPNDPETNALRADLERRMRPGDVQAPPEDVRPPSPGLLRYIAADRMSPDASDEIIRLAERFPEDPLVQLEAGTCLLGRGELERARTKFEFAARCMPNHPYVWATRDRTAPPGWSEGAYARPDARLDNAPTPPHDAAVWNDMGYLLYLQGKLDQAASCFRAAIDADPKFAAAYHNLGHVLVLQDKRDQAIEQYEKAVRAAPGEPDAYRSLATACMAQGRWAQCIEALSRGVAAMPKDKDLPLRLAWVLSIAPDEKLRDGARAVKLAEAACEGAERKSANVLNILAAAYAEKGDFAGAVAAATQAIAVARSEGNEGFAKIIEGRLKLYEEGKPCRPATP